MQAFRYAVMDADAAGSSHSRLIAGTFLFLIAAAAIILTFTVVVSDDASADISDDWTYDAAGRSLTYTGPASMPDYTSGENPITVLDAEDAMSVEFVTAVTKIGDYALYGSTLSSVSIPNTVVSIGEMSFGECTHLKTVTFKEGLRSIGERAFFSCTRLDSVSLPRSVDEIGSYAFDNCSSIKTLNLPEFNGDHECKGLIIREYTFRGCSSIDRIFIPVQVSEIRQHAFDGCSSAYYLEFDQEPSVDSTGKVVYNFSLLTDIGSYAFSGCSKVRTVLIPDHVTTLGKDPFCGMSSLESFSTTDTNTNLRVSDGVLYDNGLATLIHYPSARHADMYTIPTSATMVWDTAFNGAKNLTNISMENSDKYSSEGGVLFDKEKKTLIRYPEGRTNSSYRLPESVSCVNTNAFRGATNLENLIIPTSKVEFKEDSLNIGTFGNEYELHIDAPDGYKIPKSACGPFTTVNYGGDESGSSIAIIIIAVVAAIAVIAAVAVLIIRRKDL